MRGLNLSRLAKASEGSFFKDQQATQAAKIRKTLSENDINKLRSEQADAAPTVDKLASISAQSAYKQLVKHSVHHAPQKQSPSPSLVHRMQASSSAAYQARTPSSSSSTLDPAMMRALGSGKLNMLAEMKSADSAPRPLPGSEKYAEGAVLGIASFSIATAMVASVGLVAGLFVYFNPSVIDSIRYRTRRFARAMDASVGEHIRYRVQRIKQSGPIVSEENRGRVGRLMSGAVGMQSDKQFSSEDQNSHTQHRR